MLEIENEELDEEYIAIFFEVCECCGRSSNTLVPCPECGKLLCGNCLPPFGAHICEVDECYQLMM